MFAYLGSFAGLLLIVAAVYSVRPMLSDHRRRESFLNVSAGIAVAYAFVDVFPQLARKQLAFDSIPGSTVFAYLYHHLYVVALIGFVVYVAVRALQGSDVHDARHDASHWLMSVLLSLYCLLVGYILADQPLHRPEPALLFGLAMAAHMLGLTHQHRDYAPRRYDRAIRYLLMASVAAGWVWGMVDDLTVRTYGLWFAFIAGCIVATGTFGDLPRISTTRAVPAFALGAVGYTALLLMVEILAE